LQTAYGQLLTACCGLQSSAGVQYQILQSAYCQSLAYLSVQKNRQKWTDFDDFCF